MPGRARARRAERSGLVLVCAGVAGPVGAPTVAIEIHAAEAGDAALVAQRGGADVVGADLLAPVDRGAPGLQTHVIRGSGGAEAVDRTGSAGRPDDARVA